MFRPSKNNQHGGDYMDISSVTPNISSLTLQKELYGQIAVSNPTEYGLLIQAEQNLSTLTIEYMSTMSSLSTTLLNAASTYSTQYFENTSSYSAKSAALDALSIAQAYVSIYSTAYGISSVIYSSTLSILCTLIANESNNMNGGAIDTSTMSTYNGLIIQSTTNGLMISTNLGNYIIMSTFTIPSTQTAYREASTQYANALSTYNNNILLNASEISTYTAHLSTYNSISTLIHQQDAIVQSTYVDYVVASSALNTDNFKIQYISAAIANNSAYSIYNSTITTMKTIETLYNLVMSGLSVPTEIVEATGVQGGGSYTPLYNINPIVCDPSDSACITKRSYLNKYITTYQTLSSALPQYTSTYNAMSIALNTAKQNTNFRVSTLLKEALAQLDSNYQDALVNLPDIQNQLSTNRIEQSSLRSQSISKVYLVPSSLFTQDELNILFTGILEQTGGGQTGGQTPISQKINDRVIINRAHWNISTISSYNAALLASTTTETPSVSNDPTYTAILQTYLSTQAQLQWMIQLSTAIQNANSNNDSSVVEARIHLSSLILQKSSLEAQSTINASTLSSYNLNTIANPDFITTLIAARVSSLVNFEIYAQNLNSTLKVKYDNEMKDYINIIAQISTYIVWDRQLKIIKTNNKVPSTIVSTYSTFTNLSDQFNDLLINENQYKNLYLYTKTIYEIESVHIAQGIDIANLMPLDEYNKLKFYYDIYVGESNNAIDLRETLNTRYLSTFNNISSLLEANINSALTTTLIYSTLTQTISSKLMPYNMGFQHVSSRGVLFDRTSYIPETEIPVCLSTAVVDGTPTPQAAFITPTTTISNTPVGTTCQYIEITKPDNNIEILQVLAIDKRGRNVALGASVTITPTTSSGAINILNITNGTYSVTNDTSLIPSASNIKTLLFSQPIPITYNVSTLGSEATLHVLAGTNYIPPSVPSFPVVDVGTINGVATYTIPRPVLPGISFDNPISLHIDYRTNTLYSACRTGIFKGTSNTDMKVFAASDNYIYTIITDNDGYIYTVEDVLQNIEIRKYPVDGGLTPLYRIQHIGGALFDLPPRNINTPYDYYGTGYSPISYSSCLAVNDTYLVFADFGNSRICVFSKSNLALVNIHTRMQILGNPIGLILQNNYIRCMLLNDYGEFMISNVGVLDLTPSGISLGDIYNVPYTITQSASGIAYYSSGKDIYRLSVVVNGSGVNCLTEFLDTPPLYTATNDIIGMGTKSDGTIYYVDGTGIYKSEGLDQYQQGGQYGGQQAPNYFVSPDNSETPKKIIINLGAPTEITAIKYMKYNTSYSPVGMKFRLLNGSMAQVGSIMPITINLPSITFDMRSQTLTNDQKASIPIAPLATRNGVCGIMGRYIKLSPSTNIYNYLITQISVITTSGVNVALNKKISVSIGGINAFTNASSIINGTYTSKPVLQSFSAVSTSSNDYILIDLMNEYDITAVNLYYASQADKTIENSGVLTIYTADYMIAASQNTTKYHTSILKEILDFRRPNTNISCPTSVRLSAYYGEAGIICRYILLSKERGQLAFSKIEVIDKTGLDVAQFREAHVSSNAAIKQRGVTNYSGPRLKIAGYYSNSVINQWYYVDFGSLKEICYINLYGCTDSMNMTQGIIVSLYSTIPILSASTPLVSFSAVGGVTSQGFDTRYEPSISNYPTSVQRNITRYGPLGIFAQTIKVYAGNLISPVFSVTIVDANGLIITPESNIPGNTPTTNIFYRTYTLNRMYEITSVITNLTGAAVELYDCYNYLVAQGNSNTITPSGSSLGVYADFRNYKNGSRNIYAPVVPYPIRRGGYDLSLFTNTDPNRVTSGTTPTLSIPSNMSNSGIKARFIKIYPRDSVTPLYISQILVIDEFGINRAFEKNCTYVSAYNTNQYPTNIKYAVDGVYEAQFDTLAFLNLFYTKYNRKPESKSFVSTRGGETDANWSADENWFGIDIGLDTTTDSSKKDLAAGPEYSINSIVYVASDGRGAEAEGVIVQLLDAKMNPVGAQMVTNVASVFGVDVLDFRADTSVSILYQPNQVEVRERIIEPGPEFCGIMTQYVRVQQTDPTKPINLSQIAITDPNGNNIAQYQPTFATSANEKSYIVVDGGLSAKYSSSALKVNAGYNEYVEVNLGKEYEITSIQLVDIVNTDNSSGFNTLNVKLYNKYRDMIGSYMSYVPPAVLNALSAPSGASASLTNAPTTSDNFLYLEKVGVQIANQLISYKYNSGLLATASVSSFSTTATTPSLLRLRGRACTSVINTAPKYTRVSGGIPTKYVRVYNVDNFIQISQLMVYDTNGVNVAYQKPAFATSTLPNLYAQYATDGTGGFFHRARNEPQCYISGKNRYDYWQVDLGGTYNVIAVRYIPPATNSSRNIGTRVQLLNNNSLNQPIVLAEKIVSAQGDTTIDFRALGSYGDIRNVISPPISVLGAALVGTNYQGLHATGGNLYYISRNKLNFSSSTTSTIIYSGPTSGSVLTSCIYWLGVYYIVDNLRNCGIRITYTTVGGYNIQTGSSIYNRPYSITCSSGFSNYFFISENRINGNIYMCDRDGSFQNTGMIIYTANNILSIVLVSSDILLACVGNQIIKIQGFANRIFKNVISDVLAGSGSSCLPNLTQPTGLAFDEVNNIVFVSCLTPPTVYSINLNTAVTWELTAGVSTQLQYPQFLSYSSATGILYISDKFAGICEIDLSSRSPLSFPATTSYNLLFTTSTLPGNEAGINNAAAIVARPITYDTYKYTKTLPMLYETINLPEIQCCCISPYTHKMYVCSSTKIYEYTESSNGTLSNTQTLTLSKNFNITSITASSTHLYFASPIDYKIYKLPIQGLSSSTPIAYIGTTSGAFSPDGTSITNSYIIPQAVCFIGTTLYFSDNQSKCCFIRRVDSANNIQTLAGSNNVPSVALTQYYDVSSDLNRAEYSNSYGIKLIHVTSMIADPLGYIYIADAGNNCIHRLTPYGTFQPICGPFREDVPFLNTFGSNTIHPGYSVKVNNPTGLAFDSNMNLICTLSEGCQIIRITKINSIEPQVEVISGLGVDILNIQPYSSSPRIAMYADLNSPTSIAYSFLSNSFYFVDYGNSVLRQLTQITQSVIYNGNNGVISYGLSNKLSYMDNSTHFTIHQNGNIYYLKNGGEIHMYNSSTSSSSNFGQSGISEIHLYNQEYLICLKSNSLIIKINIHNPSLEEIYRDTGIKHICVHENGCIFISYSSSIKQIYIRSIIKLPPSSLSTGDNKSYSYDNLCVDSNNLFVTRTDSKTIVQYTLTFTYVAYDTSFSISPALTLLAPVALLKPILHVTMNPSSTSTKVLYSIDNTFLYRTMLNSDYSINTSYTNNRNTAIPVSNPSHIFYYNNFIYISNTGNNNIIQQSINAGQTIYPISGSTTTFSSPSGIFANSSGIYVADTGNKRICLIRTTNGSIEPYSTGDKSPIGIFIVGTTILYTHSNKIYKRTIGSSDNSQEYCSSSKSYSLGQLSYDSISVKLFTSDSDGNIWQIIDPSGIGNSGDKKASLRLIHIIENIVGLYVYNSIVYYTIKDSNLIKSFVVNPLVTYTEANKSTYTGTISAMYSDSKYLYYGLENRIVRDIILKSEMDTNQQEDIYGTSSTTTGLAVCFPLEVQLNNIKCIGSTYDNNIIVCDSSKGYKVNSIQPTSINTIYTAIGYAGMSGAGGDGKIATLTKLNKPIGCCYDTYGNIYIVDNLNKCIRRIDAASGIVSNVTSGNLTIGKTIDGLIDVQVNSAGVVYALTSTQIYTIVPYSSHYVVGSHYSIDRISGGTITTPRAADSTSINITSTSSKIYFLSDMIKNSGVLIAGNIYTYRIVVQANVTGASLSLEYRSDPVGSYNILYPIGITATTITGRFTAISPNIYFKISGKSQVNLTFTTLIITSVDRTIHTRTYAYSAPMPICGDSTMGINNSVAVGGSSLANARSIRIDSLGNIYVSCSENNPADNKRTGIIRRIDARVGIITQFAGGFNECIGMGLDSSNNLYIADNYTKIVYKFSTINQQTIFQNVAGQYTTLQQGGYAFTTGNNKPYGIAVDSNNNIYISCYSSTNNEGAHKIMKYNSNLTLAVENFIGTGTAAASPYNYYCVPINTALKNPQHLSIDKNNRLLFTQDGLHSVLLVPLSNTINTINNVSLVRIENADPGKSVSLNSCNFNGTSIAPTITTSGITTSSALPFTSDTTDTNPFILFTFSSPVSISSILLKADSTRTDAVGMRVLLFNSVGTLLSNRVTTNKILANDGCTIKYDTTAGDS
jgi:hypothetical protein